MLILIFFVILLLGSIAGYIQWKHAEANYPSSWQWKVLLFFSGFVACGVGVWLLPFSNLSLSKQFLLVLGGGLFGGYGSLVLLPQKMQMIHPKRE